MSRGHSLYFFSSCGATGGTNSSAVIELCEHVFEDTPALFTATARTRACRKCKRVEVMLASTGEWVAIDAYLQRRIANNTASD